MEAVASGASASIVGIVIVAIIIGAINGSVFWSKRNGLVIGVLASIAILLLLTAFMVGYSSAGVTLWSLPSLLLAFLASYLVALKVHASHGLNAIWCSVIAFFVAIGNFPVCKYPLQKPLPPFLYNDSDTVDMN